MKFVIPFFAVSVVLLFFTIAWLTFSDEASQKRSLYESWDQVSQIQWFYNDDSIDLFVYSETLDTLLRIPGHRDRPFQSIVTACSRPS